MTNIVYYAVDKVNESLTSTALPKNLQKHAYKAESISVWHLLIDKYKQVFNIDLPSVEFLKSGKPIIENGYISLSHGAGVVAVCFSKTVEVGIDVESVKPQVPANLSKFLSESEPTLFYKKWTEREAVIKAKNYSALKKGAEIEFEGETQTIYINEKAFSLAIHGKNATFIKV